MVGMRTSRTKVSAPKNTTVVVGGYTLPDPEVVFWFRINGIFGYNLIIEHGGERVYYFNDDSEAMMFLLRWT